MAASLKELIHLNDFGLISVVNYNFIRIFNIQLIFSISYFRIMLKRRGAIKFFKSTANMCE